MVMVIQGCPESLRIATCNYTILADAAECSLGVLILCRLCAHNCRERAHEMGTYFLVWLVLSVLAEAATAGCGQELMKIRVFPRDLLLLQRKIDRVDFTHIDPDVFLMFGYQVITDKKITGATKGRHSFIVIVNATGDIVGASRWNMRLWTPKLLNCSTVYMLSTTTDTHEDYRSNARFTLWNAESDRMIRVPIRGATHDLHYDPGSQTLFWLKNLMLHNPCQFPNSVCPDKKLVAAAFKSDNILRCKINGQVWVQQVGGGGLLSRVAIKKKPLFSRFQTDDVSGGSQTPSSHAIL